MTAENQAEIDRLKANVEHLMADYVVEVGAFREFAANWRARNRGFRCKRRAAVSRETPHAAE